MKLCQARIKPATELERKGGLSNCTGSCTFRKTHQSSSMSYSLLHGKQESEGHRLSIDTINSTGHVEFWKSEEICLVTRL